MIFIIVFSLLWSDSLFGIFVGKSADQQTNDVLLLWNIPLATL